ncbi:MAG: deoxyribodipyrimidine photo-lyase [Isosphaeraceae bacterium]
MTLRAATTLIQETRIQPLNDRKPAKGQYVLYWMQQSQRAEFNHALEYAVQRANELDQPLLIGFGLMDDYPEANLRHYHFMLQGLQETQQTLRQRGLQMAISHGSPDAVALGLARKASVIVCDRGYLRHQKLWRRRVSDTFGGEVVQVESDSVVPVEVASDKAEHAARTLRPRIHRHLDDYLVDLIPTPVARESLALDAGDLDLGDLDALLLRLKLDRSVPAVRLFRGGTSEAKTRLQHFLRRQLEGYVAHRNQPQTEDVSHMSKYLHFGQISPVDIVLQVRKIADYEEGRAKYLEELVVRRELTHNFVHFTEDYDRYNGLPAWARATLDARRDDVRPQCYTRDELDSAETHDPYWNAAMREMKHTGYMHNYMRMYWGKKILEWSPTPESAHRVALELNNRYFLDGRDAASFANIGWVFGLHDRPWPGRAVYGNVRSMSAGGLERKADMPAYIARVDELVRKVLEPDSA